MAVTPTFPSRESLRRLRFRPLDAVVGLGVFLLVYAVVRVGASAQVPFHPGRSAATISSSPAELPFGWGVRLEPGDYQLRRRDDTAIFGSRV